MPTPSHAGLTDSAFGVASRSCEAVGNGVWSGLLLKKRKERRAARHLPAKLIAPQAEDAIPRARLFRVLDRLTRKQKVVWIHAPAGAGKTTLAASYLAAGGIPALWYEVD